MAAFDFNQFYAVDGYAGIAWHAIEHPTTWAYVDVFYEDENGDEVWFTDGEEVTDYERVVCIMVGDDRRFEFEISELTAISEDDFCAGCGQIGCGH